MNATNYGSQRVSTFRLLRVPIYVSLLKFQRVKNPSEEDGLRVVYILRSRNCLDSAHTT